MSMGSVAIPRVKKAIQSLHYGECQALAERMLSMDTEEESRKALIEVAQRSYPELVT
jgi:phosphoenolpyruvate-protein phosphotransferase (PTS system enzyme I)